MKEDEDFYLKELRETRLYILQALDSTDHNKKKESNIKTSLIREELEELLKIK
jgi:hypothetical protein